MASLSPQQFVKKKRLFPLIFLFGPEVNFIKRLLERIKKQLEISTEGIRELNGKDISLETFINETSCNVLFCDKKLIIVKEAFSFWRSLKKDEQKLLEETLRKLPKGTFVVFIENSEITKDYGKHPFVKLLNETGVVVLCRKATRNELISWLRKKLKNFGIEDEAFLNYLIDISDGSVEILEKEIEKLLLSLNKDALSEAKNFNPFNMIYLALAGDWKAMEMMDKILSTGIMPVVLLGAFQSVIRRYFLYITGIEKIREFEKRRFDTLNWDEKRLKSALLKLFQLEMKLKTSSVDAKKAFEEFLIWLLLNSRKVVPDREESSLL